MSTTTREVSGPRELMMGNEAIARGALEAGVHFVAGYPGTPSSEIVETVARYAREPGVYVEWSINEKVAAEAAAAASFAGLSSLTAMKTAGLNVALDFLAHLGYSGLGEHGGSMVVAVCDDPEGHSSGDEADSRWFAKVEGIPLLEPDSPQEAKDMTGWAFELSKEFNCYVMVRSYTRLSLASGPVTLGNIPAVEKKAHFDTSQKTISPYMPRPNHAKQHERLARIRPIFERSSFNWYQGPENPELIIICSGIGTRYSLEAIGVLGLEKSVGILKLGTLWPFPRELVAKHLVRTNQVLAVEEVDPFLESHTKILAFESPAVSSALKIYGKDSGHIPAEGELTPTIVMQALSNLFELNYAARDPEYERQVSDITDKMLINRGVAWCPGCPHRASFWAIKQATKKDGRDGFPTGDIGCYTLDVYPSGSQQIKALHAMGSGVGLASGFGKLDHFGSEQPVIAICGDSTFFHASIPGLINAVRTRSNMVLVLLDNSATAMTGFQPHPGTETDIMGEAAPVISAEAICRSIGCHVEAR
jgi:indolepyruvate ferredoxin oxidoreductase alpha subunit